MAPTTKKNAETGKKLESLLNKELSEWFVRSTAIMKVELRAKIEKHKTEIRTQIAQRSTARIAFDNAIITLAIDLAKIKALKSAHTVELENHIATLIELIQDDTSEPVATQRASIQQAPAATDRTLDVGTSSFTP